MKFQKRIDDTKHADIYVLHLDHKEAELAFKAMTPEERVMIHDLQRSEQVSTLLKILTLWAQKIEETQSRKGSNSEAIYEG